MKYAIIAVAIAATFPLNANAHGCSGPGACQTIQHKPTSNAQQGQKQQQAQEQQQRTQQALSNQTTAQGGSSTNGVNIGTGNNRSFTVFPVTVVTPPIITPAAGISRMVDPTCGPRMRVVSTPVRGVNNRFTKAQEYDIGVDQEVIPDPHQAYRKVYIGDGVYQLIGHRVSETSAVVTISNNHGFGIGGNSNNGGGASLGVSGGGAMQQLVNTIRLAECVMVTVDERPRAKPVQKKRVVRKPVPAKTTECNVCKARTVTTTTTTTTTVEPK